jgi:hypothetical protein
VEIRSREFEFMKNNKYTGNYARGLIIAEDISTYTVDLLNNGKQYKVNKDICITL